MARRIKSRTKFSNVDILSFMGNVVQKHTKHYQSDFEIDREILTKAADRQEQQDKTFIWLWGTAHKIPVKETGMATTEDACHPSLTPLALTVLP